MRIKRRYCSGRESVCVPLPRFFFRRGTAEAFGTDEKAAKLAKEVINKGWDTSGEYTPLHRSFLYMPLMHSEDLSAQVTACRVVDTCNHFRLWLRTPAAAFATVMQSISVRNSETLH